VSCLTKLTLVAGVIGALALAPAALAAEPVTELNPPPPDFYTCKSLGAGTLCTATRSFVKDEELQPELVCGSGADAFNIYDNGVVHERLTRWYDADGNLTRRVIRSVWTPAWWSNPLNGETVPYTQRGKTTTVLAVPGDFDSATETSVGENIYTDPETHQKVLRTTGRVVFGADGTLELSAGQHWEIDAFVFGDMSVLDAVCAALAS
jgi:hypothetical protein